MSYFKRFTDFCAGLVAFDMLIYVLSKFMTYTHDKDAGMLERIKFFFSKENSGDYRAFLILIILLVVSIAAGRIFERFPYISLAVSMLPAIQLILLFGDGKIKERSVFCVLLTILHVGGNIIHAISLDKKDGKRRAFICANLLGVSFFAFALMLWRKASTLLALTLDEAEELSARDYEIFVGAEEDVHKLILKISIIVLISVAISFILRDLYFIDAILAAVPFAYTVYLFSTDKLTIFPGTVFIITLMYLLSRIIILLSEPMAKKRKFLKAKEQGA